MGAESAGNSIKVSERWLISVQNAGLIFEGVFEGAVPCALEYLEGLVDDPGTVGREIAFGNGEKTILHFLFGGVSREAEPHRFAEVAFVVGNEIQRALMCS